MPTEASAQSVETEIYTYAPSVQSLGVLACGLREQPGPDGGIELHPVSRGWLSGLTLALFVSAVGFGVGYGFAQATGKGAVVFWTIGLTATLAGIVGGLVTMGLSRQYAPYAPLLAWNPRTGELTLDGGKITLRRDEIQHLSFDSRCLPHFHGAEGNVIVNALVVTTTDGRRIIALPLPLFSRCGATAKAVLAKVRAT